MKRKYVISIYTVSAFVVACNFIACSSGVNKQKAVSTQASHEKGSFAYDLEFLKKYDEIVVLKTEGDRSQIAVSPKYQAKVFTSTAEGEGGQSFGWLNYKVFGDKLNPHVNCFGGENRFWLGPEGGKYSLFFKPGSKMDFEHWQSPAAFDSEPWELLSKNDTVASMRKTMQLENYAGTKLDIQADRTVTILKRSQAESMLGVGLDTSVSVVAYKTDNIITNKGKKAWTEASGMPCIWMLDMFNPGTSTTIVLRVEKKGKKMNELVTSNYFGDIPPSRLMQDGNFVYLKADGKSRGKVGIRSGNAVPISGSYDDLHHVLTITSYELSPGSKYLNQEWNTSKPVFTGDAVNAYNDGPLADGSQLGPFYEMESVGPAASLKPGESTSHKHSVFHFTGERGALNKISEKVLGVSLSKIKGAFPDTTGR